MTGRPSELPAGRLVELTVSNLALIERLRLELGTGLNVVTGETGAGKSLVIDALGLALGARSDTSLVRHGADSARVEALFDRLPEPLIAARELTAAGRSTARLDDDTVTASRLADVTGRLVEIHGQHDQQRLLDERWQRDVLDVFGGHGDARAAVADAVERWGSNRAALAELAIDPRDLGRRLELLDHEAAEIAAARLQPGEAASIRSRLAAAQHVETIVRGSVALLEALNGDGGARDRVALARREAIALARVDPRFEPLATRLSGLEAEIDDAASEARGLADDVDHDPGELLQLEERLSLIYGLERRYGDDEEAVLAHAARATAESDRLRGLEGERARRQAEDEALLTEIAAGAQRLSRLRGESAERLRDTIGSVLETLGFPQGVFDVAVGRRPAGPHEPAVEVDGDAVAFDASGVDEVVYRLAPNRGEPARPLARIASGGEMSRVALAIKQVLAEADDTPTLVFDEVDNGIGGRSANPVGRSLWALARRHLVIVVTHLPQIAAYADTHFRIAKREQDGRTVTDVATLDREGRIVELAQMLGGAATAADSATLASAREMLDRAEAWRGHVLASG